MLSKRLLALSALAILLVPSATAMAEDVSGSGGSSDETQSTVSTEHHQSGKAVTTATESTTSNEAANKLKACQNREASINKRMQNIATRGQKQLDLFTTIANRVEKFYTDKNLSLSNYDSLVSAVNAKKATAQTTVDQIKSDSVSFKCDGTDPKGEVTAFKTDLKNEISALKEYRTSVKNLITGVKSALGTTNSTEGQNNG